MQTLHDAVGPVNEQERDLSLSTLMGDIAKTHAVVSSGPIPLASGVSEAISEHQVGLGRSEVISFRASYQPHSALSGSEVIPVRPRAHAT
eukprot:4575685-Pyramimonas_sp.AAC.1